MIECRLRLIVTMVTWAIPAPSDIANALQGAASRACPHGGQEQSIVIWVDNGLTKWIRGGADHQPTACLALRIMNNMRPSGFQ